MKAELNSDRLSGRDSRPAVPGLAASFDAGAAGRKSFTIRELTKEFGISARTLRFYEEKGLIVPRRNGQERLYSRRDRARPAEENGGRRRATNLRDPRSKSQSCTAEPSGIETCHESTRRWKGRT